MGKYMKPGVKTGFMYVVAQILFDYKERKVCMTDELGKIREQTPSRHTL